MSVDELTHAVCDGDANLIGCVIALKSRMMIMKLTSARCRQSIGFCAKVPQACGILWRDNDHMANVEGNG